MNALRTRVAAAILGALALPSSSLRQGGDPPHTRIDRPSAEACGECHANVVEEWAESLHHRAWTNANVRVATHDFAKEQCRACHSPMPVLLASEPEVGPDFRDFNHEDGVHCLSCHGLEDGVAAARTIDDAPCRPRFDARFVSADLCYSCHQPTHQAFDEYRRSDAQAVGLRCADCHMPQRPHAPGHSHGSNGGLNPDFVRRAVHWECALVDGRLAVTLRNRTGHRLPGEIPSRALIVRVDRLDGEVAYVTLRRPGKEEERLDDRLDVDEERVLWFDLDGSEVREVKLLWKTVPLMPEEDAILVGQWTPEENDRAK